ncbi:MAG: glycosyltransferase family 2 protein [Patescibacteria group bacterium]
MQASFVIPTYNRSTCLKDCIEHLFEQNFVKSEFEIVVVDDGSTDDTKEVVEDLQNGAPIEIQYFRQENQGQGIARNLGVMKARGKIIVLIGDDIIVTPDFLREHMKIHNKYHEENVAVLGLILWHPDTNKTPLMNFLTDGSAILGRFGGHQFAFEKLAGKKMADFNFFYTSNISLKRSLMLKYSFDPIFSKYGWEDIELGYRLTKEAFMKLHYNRFAIGYHLHDIDERSFKNRMQMIGRSAKVIDAKYPELKKNPPKWKKFVFSVLSSTPVIRLLKKDSLMYYYALSKKYFLEGLEE